MYFHNYCTKTFFFHQFVNSYYDQSELKPYNIFGILGLYSLLILIYFYYSLILENIKLIILFFLSIFTISYLFSEILTSTFNEIESRSTGAAVAGIPVNFYDLDAMTQGLQRSDLIIVAGRPAMGKTSIVLNLAKNVAQLHDLPVCVFSLEMSKEQLTYRLLSSEVGIESSRLRTGRLQQDEWPLLGQGINTLGQLPIFIDDKPNSSVLEMRSLCRRLIAEQGKELGLIVIDYLQLMEGTSPDNRVQEISRITRGLKGMAR